MPRCSTAARLGRLHRVAAAQADKAFPYPRATVRGVPIPHALNITQMFDGRKGGTTTQGGEDHEGGKRYGVRRFGSPS